MMSGAAATAVDSTSANTPRNVWASIRSTLFVAFGGILFGFDIGVIAGVQAMRDWSCTFGKLNPSTGLCAITSTQQSLAVATMPIGTFFGALFAGPTGDFLGRRWSIVIGLIIFAVGVSMQTAATALPLFYVGRVVAGWGVGMGTTLILIYQSECSPKWIRGTIVAAYEWVLTIGALIAAIINNATKDIPSHAAWRIPTSIQFVWASILAIGMILIPESPRWLIQKGRDEDAARALSRLTSLPLDHPEVQAELGEIHLSFQKEKELSESSYLDCFRPSHNKVLLRTCTGIFLPLLVQFSGVGFILYYGTIFFLNAGVKDPFLITIATSLILVVMTLPGMWGVERFGRRRLMLVGAVGMCISQFLVAIIGVTISTSNTTGQKALVALVCIFIAIYASTWAPVSFVILSEIFPPNVRAKAMSLAGASNCLFDFAIAYAAPYLVNKQPGSAGLEVKVFFIWGTTCFGCILFTYFCIPETKGLSLEQIDLLYQNTTPMRSVSYRRQLERDGVKLTFSGARAERDSASESKEKV